MTAPAVPASFAEVLPFRHPGVIRRYCKDHGASPAEAQEVFQEMLKWLYLGSRCTADPQATAGCVMTEEIEKIDWMWHTFLLFSGDYAASATATSAPSCTTSRRTKPTNPRAWRRYANSWSATTPWSATCWASQRCSSGMTSVGTPPRRSGGLD